ncbi:hypothetical protein T03_10561 [Trichinella britovi]|uniref:Uncharacterized protein n=1 Tax=Trichinella britovi TaxID=45882 RepID=A0A0V1CP85_TRIBR|nr:hypothetical protein T03_10561 [Trichinella britovi]
MGNSSARTPLPCCTTVEKFPLDFCSKNPNPTKNRRCCSSFNEITLSCSGIPVAVVLQQLSRTAAQLLLIFKNAFHN